MARRNKPVYSRSLVGSHSRGNSSGRHRECSDNKMDKTGYIGGDLSEITDQNIRELVFKYNTGRLDSY